MPSLKERRRGSSGRKSTCSCFIEEYHSWLRHSRDSIDGGRCGLRHRDLLGGRKGFSVNLFGASNYLARRCALPFFVPDGLINVCTTFLEQIEYFFHACMIALVGVEEHNRQWVMILANLPTGRISPAPRAVGIDASVQEFLHQFDVAVCCSADDVGVELID